MTWPSSVYSSLNETISLHSTADVQVSGPTEPEPGFSDDIGTDLHVPEDQSLLDTLHVEATKTEEELLADALLLQQHIGDDTSAMETDNVDVAKPVVSCRDGVFHVNCVSRSDMANMTLHPL
jgi:hypothetical protein